MEKNFETTNNDSIQEANPTDALAEMSNSFDAHRAETLVELESKNIKGLSETQKQILLDNPNAILAQQEGGIKSNGIMSKDLVPDSENPDIRALFESGTVSIVEDGKIHLNCLEKGQKDFIPSEKTILAYEPLNDKETGERIVKDGVPQWNIYDCSRATIYEDRGDGPQVYKVPAPVIFMPTESGKVPAPLEGIAHIDEDTNELLIPREEGAAEDMRSPLGDNAILQIRKNFMEKGTYDGRGATILTKTQGIDEGYKVVIGKDSGKKLGEVLGIPYLQNN